MRNTHAIHQPSHPSSRKVEGYFYLLQAPKPREGPENIQQDRKRNVGLQWHDVHEKFAGFGVTSPFGV